MSTNFPYPLASPALGLLDLTPTLLPTPTTLPDLTYTSLPSIAFLLLADRLGELYEMTFPDQPHWLSEERVDWQNQEDIASAVERFLGRVSDLFPIQDEIWELEPEVAPGEVSELVEWRLTEIPMIPMGFDFWYEGWDDYKEPVPYLLHLHFSRGEINHFGHRDTFADLYPEHPLPLQVEPHRLVDTLRQMACQQALPGPLVALPDLIEMLDSNTGNPWLDVGEVSLADSDGYPSWSAEIVADLAQAWQQAQPVVERVYQLLDWHNETPDEVGIKLTAVRNILLAAYQRTQGWYQPQFQLEVRP